MFSPFNRIFGIGEKTNKEENDYHPDEVVQLPIKNILPNRYQPRTIFDEEKINELAQTIRTHGMIQPIIVRKLENDQYELVAGERRWRAIQSLGWETISAIIRDMNDAETASIALIENLQREELTVIEEATAYEQLLKIHSLTQEALAQRLGKSQSTIANKLRLLQLPEEIQQSLLNKVISERHARALISLKDKDDQIYVLKEIIDKQLNVKQTEDLIKTIHKPPKQKQAKKQARLKGIHKDIRIAMNTIRQSLSMVSDTGIKVESEEEELDDYYQITIKIPKKEVNKS